MTFSSTKAASQQWKLLQRAANKSCSNTASCTSGRVKNHHRFATSTRVCQLTGWSASSLSDATALLQAAKSQQKYRSMSTMAVTSNHSSAFATMAREQAPSSDSLSRITAWEVVMGTMAAFLASATLVYSFPSQNSDSLFRFSGGGGGGGGPPTPPDGGYHATAIMLHGDNDGALMETENTDFDKTYEPVNQENLRRHDKSTSRFEAENQFGIGVSGMETRSPYDTSVRALKGCRMTMEDEYCVAAGGRFAAVFDGHGGSGVSQYLKNNLYQALQRNLENKVWEETELVHAHHQERKDASVFIGSDLTNSTAKAGSNEQQECRIPSVASQAAALRSAFAEIERDVIADDSLGYQGSTAVAVVVHESEDGHRTLLSANVGDSRAILSRRGKAVELTRDHKPNEEREKARILAMGETIEWDRWARVHRVRSLSLSRAIGDRYAKPAVSSEVEIKHFPIIEEDGADEFVLLASDGLWDVMSSDDVVRFVHNFIDKEMAKEEEHNLSKEELENYKHVLRRNMAKFVAREAIRRGTADNTCVIMVWLNDVKKK